MFTESYNGGSMKFKGRFKEVTRVFQGSFMEMSRMFQESLKGV